MALKKIILVFNPHSSRSDRIEQDVLPQLRKIRGLMVGRFEVTSAKVGENAKLLAKMIDDGDLIISAGGDGTAAVAVNSIMLSRKKAIFAPLKLGNFNDCSRTLKTTHLEDIITRYKKRQTLEVYPLQIKVNNKHWRYALCYLTIGLFAESTQVFEDPKVRGKKGRCHHGLMCSIRRLAGWYFKNKRRQFLPKNTKINGQLVRNKTSDYLAVNSKTVAQIMRGGNWYLDRRVFWSSQGRLTSFWRLIIFMARSILHRIPGELVDKDTIEFKDNPDIMLHAEGEVEIIKKATKIEVSKTKNSLSVVSFE